MVSEDSDDIQTKSEDGVDIASCETPSKIWYNDDTAPFFWVLVSIRALVALIGIVGNSMVIHASIKSSNTIGKSFRYLNRVVLSLAIADLLYSLQDSHSTLCTGTIIYRILDQNLGKMVKHG